MNALLSSSVSPDRLSCPQDTDDNIVWNTESGAKTPIKSASLLKLVERLTDNHFQDLDFRFVFVLTYPMFTTAGELLDLLFRRFDLPYPPNSTPSEIQLFKKSRMAPIQIKVLGVIKYWVQEYYEDFCNDSLDEHLQLQIRDTMDVCTAHLRD